MSTVVLCGAIVETCLCVLLPKHEDPHECECDGSWTTMPDGSFDVVVRLPQYEGARADRLRARSLSR